MQTPARAVRKRALRCRLAEAALLSFPPWGVLCGLWMSQLSRDMPVGGGRVPSPQAALTVYFPVPG